MVGWLSVDEGLVVAMLGVYADLPAVVADFDERECRRRELHAGFSGCRATRAGTGEWSTRSR